jgi:class 3 adenylate cyclase
MGGKGGENSCSPIWVPRTRAQHIVARLNALFEIVMPAIVNAGGHVDRLGDRALVASGASNDLAAHADAAVNAAVLIQRFVAEEYEGAVRIGVGINTRVVIAGTVGGGGKLDFTLIADTVNVAARVEDSPSSQATGYSSPTICRHVDISTPRTGRRGDPIPERKVLSGGPKRLRVKPSRRRR